MSSISRAGTKTGEILQKVIHVLPAISGLLLFWVKAGKKLVSFEDCKLPEILTLPMCSADCPVVSGFSPSPQPERA